MDRRLTLTPPRAECKLHNPGSGFNADALPPDRARRRHAAAGMALRNNRAGQFPPFDPASGLLRLGRYAAATVFGGLPLYAAGVARTALAALLAGALSTLPRPHRGAILLLLLLIQAAALAGMMTRPETMQPQQRTARAAATLAGTTGLVLVRTATTVSASWAR